MSEDRSVLTRTAPPPDEVVRYGEHPDHVIDVWRAADGAVRRPTVVLVHGGFWRPDYDRTHLRPMANALQSAGWDVAAVEYRRIPGDPDATVADVSVAVAVVDPPVVTVGHSAGGHLVLWAATRVPAITATIALAPVADLRLAHDLGLGDGAAEAFCGTDPGDRADLDPCRLPSPTTPVVAIHGTDDEIVPLSLSESYARRHPETRLVPAEGAGHFALIDPQSATWPTVVAAIERCSPTPERVEEV